MDSAFFAVDLCIKSNAVAVLHIVFTTFYGASLGYGFNGLSEAPWIYLALMALVIPHYLQLLKHHPDANITSILNWLLPLSVILTLGTFLKNYRDLG